MVSKNELIKVVEELNDKIVDPPIKIKDEKKMKKQILKAAKFIEKGDDISKESMTIIKKLKGKKSAKTTEEVEPVSNKKDKKSKKEKTSNKKDKKKKSKQGTRKPGIGTFIVENLQSGKFKKLSDQQIVDRVMKKFPDAGTKAENISGYRKTADA